MSVLRTIVINFVAIIHVIVTIGLVDGSHFKTILNVGYLTAIKGDLKDRQGLAISGAIQMALEEINDDPKILPNVTLNLKWNDTRGDTVVATRAITEMICDDVSVIFGPEGTCYVEAIVTQSRNIPMIAYVRLFLCSLLSSIYTYFHIFFLLLLIEMFRFSSFSNSNICKNRTTRHSSESLTFYNEIILILMAIHLSRY